MKSDATNIEIPDFALVVLIGARGSGKSTFAAKHFLPTEVISSDRCRGLVCDNENDQAASADAFELVREIAGRRLKNRRLTVIDATNVRAADRKGWVELARRWHALPVAIVLDPSIEVCIERNKTRPDRNFGPQVVLRMVSEIRRGLGGLPREGFRHVWKLAGAGSIEAATVARQPLWADKRHDHGPFDIIGDVHGCAGELQALLTKLGYDIVWSGDGRTVTVTPPAGRKAVFAGDLVDRGPNVPDVLRIAMSMVAAETAYAVRGNHENKFERWLAGRRVTVGRGLQQSIHQLERLEKEEPGFRKALPRFLDGLRSHVWLDGGRLAVAHAGLKEEMVGRASGAIRSFALYGDTTGEVDEFGLPVRADWAAGYRGPTVIVYGHTPVLRAEWVNNTICIDTACVFGGKLTALRWPEKELVDVPAAQVWFEPTRPIGAPRAGDVSAQAGADQVLDIADVSGRRWIDTALRGRVVVAEENAAAALEVMSRFTMAPQWLAYLPPTMSPPETSTREGWLERPEEAFGYFRDQGVVEVVCEEKHMGSRAVIALCRTADAARDRFGLATRETGAIWTRTGRAFFNDKATAGVLARLSQAVDAIGLWDELETRWLLLDAEIMPWSAKAGGLIETQYAPVAAASTAGFAAANDAFARAAARGLDVAAVHDRFADRAGRAARYGKSFAPYVWEVAGIDDLKVAPFHLLASEGQVRFDQDHVWHMRLAGRLAAVGEKIVAPTRWRTVALDDATAVHAAVAWWEALTADGGEGMVVKPRTFVARGPKGLIQPALKVRGREYLRIIYGPEYDAPDNLERLRSRGLGGKRNLALREFALGHEALRRFVAREPLRRVHECVFAVLALESEPIDPRL
jgi:protein phosphatase